MSEATKALVAKRAAMAQLAWHQSAFARALRAWAQNKTPETAAAKELASAALTAAVRADQAAARELASARGQVIQGLVRREGAS